MTINREQAHALADLARTIRSGWDTRAIVKAIEQVADRDLAQVAWALIRVAENPDMRTPTALTWEGDHWRAMDRVGETVEELAARKRRQIDGRREEAEARRNRTQITGLARQIGRLIRPTLQTKPGADAAAGDPTPTAPKD